MPEQLEAEARTEGWMWTGRESGKGQTWQEEAGQEKVGWDKAKGNAESNRMSPVGEFRVLSLYTTALGIPGTVFKCHNIIGFRSCKDQSDYIAETGPGIRWDRVRMTLQEPGQLFVEPQQWWEMERNRWLQRTLILVIEKSDFCLLWLIWQCMETFSSAPTGKKEMLLLSNLESSGMMPNILRRGRIHREFRESNGSNTKTKKPLSRCIFREQYGLNVKNQLSVWCCIY